MEFLEKSKVRLEHWISHNQHHVDDYKDFADQLDKEGKKESAEHIREMIGLTSRCTECLQKALAALGL